MFDLYKKRLGVHGATPSNYLKNSHDEAVNASFCFDPNYKQCLINGYKIDTKFQRGSTTDVDDDRPYYYLEFRPDEPLLNVTYNNDGTPINPQIYIGAIIDMPEDHPLISDYDWWINRESDPKHRGCYITEDGTYYRRWMIADILRHEQDRKYIIQECDWCLNWIDANRVRHKQLGVMRVRNSYSSGIFEKYYMTQVEAQDSIWIPTTEETKTLTYDQRFLISDNELHPQAYKLSGVYTTKPVGLTRLILTQVVTESDDDFVNMLANGLSGYVDQIETPEVEEPDAPPLFYVTGSNNTEDVIFMDYDRNTFSVEITEPANDSVRHDYLYEWSVEPVDADSRSQQYFDAITLSDTTQSLCKIFVPLSLKLINKHLRVICNVTCVQTGEVKSHIWDALPIERS